MAGLFPGTTTLLGTDINAIDVVLVDASGNPVFGFDPSRPATGTLTHVTPATTSSTLLAANPARRYATFYNATNKIAYISLNATSSLTAYSFQLAIGGTYTVDGDEYAGAVSVIAQSTPTGNVYVTEVTP